MTSLRQTDVLSGHTQRLLKPLHPEKFDHTLIIHIHSCLAYFAELTVELNASSRCPHPDQTHPGLFLQLIQANHFLAPLRLLALDQLPPTRCFLAVIRLVALLYVFTKSEGVIKVNICCKSGERSLSKPSPHLARAAAEVAA